MVRHPFAERLPCSWRLQFLPAVELEYVCRQGLIQICEEQALSTRPMSLLEAPVGRRGAGTPALALTLDARFNTPSLPHSVWKRNLQAADLSRGNIEVSQDTTHSGLLIAGGLSVPS